MAKVNGLDKMSYGDLAELKEQIEAAMLARKAADAAALKQQIEDLVSASGFTSAELFGGKRTGRKSVGGTQVKFRNPKDPSQTWSGRGRKPNWLVEATKKGAKLDSFAA